MLAIDATGMALLSALVEALPHPVYVQESSSGAFLYGNRHFRRTFPEPPRLEGEGEFHDAAADRWYVLRSHPLSWIDGRRVSLCVLSDITEERRARELIAKHRDAAHRTARLIALGEFASALAHELNQPLAAIATTNHSCMRMVQSGNANPEELLQALHICRDQAKRAGKIIQRLRGLLRHPGPALAAQDLNELVEAVQDLAAERRRVTVATRIEADGSGTLAVSDLGDGVPAEVREHLFGPFVTTKRGGLGLGLSICRSVVEAHGGAIRHQDNAPGGARFAFTLPR